MPLTKESRRKLIAEEVDKELTKHNTDVLARLVFYTTPDGSAEPVEHMRIDNMGRIKYVTHKRE